MEPQHRTVQTPDGRSLSTYIWGHGDTVVVFEAGLGASGRCWARVAQLLSNQVTAVAYDRAGYGTSSEAQGPRTLDALAVDLVCVVQAQATPTVTLVGHSWGGPVVRRAAQLLPTGAVSSLVLVDPSDEHAPGYFTRSARVSDRLQAVVLPTIGRAGLLGAAMRRGFGRFLEADDLEATVRASSTPTAVRTCITENQHIRDGLQQLLSTATPADVPAVVISGTRATRLSKARRQLLKAHAQSVAANPRWRRADAAESTHYVLFTQPQLVADEILRATH